jgi:hypothetical protein
MMKLGWTMGGDMKKEQAIWIEKDGKTIVFDLMIPTPKGMLFAIYFSREQEIAGAGADTTAKMSVQMAHERLGHCGEDLTRKTAKLMGWELTPGELKPCQACAAGKAKQKNVPKASEHKSSKVSNERVYLDIATVKTPMEGPKVTKPHWRIIVDERSQLKFSDFYESKSGMVEPTCQQFQKWKDKGKAVKFVRLDNAGENKALQKRCESESWKLNIDFEYTARDTPQQNHLAELGFSIIASRGRAMMHRANLPLDKRYKLYREAFSTATLLDGLISVTIDGETKSRYQHWGGENPKFAMSLRTWGEAGTVKLKTLATPKIADRGVQCMFIGYADHHDGDCYRMWDPRTQRVHVTRDVIWLKRMFFEKPIERHDIVVEPVQMDFEEADMPAEEAGEGNGEDDHNEGEVVKTKDQNGIQATTRYGRVITKPVRLIDEMNAMAGDYEIKLTEAEKHYYAEMKSYPEYITELACVGAGIGGGFSNTQELHVLKYKQAMKTEEKEHWEKAVLEEHQRMEKHKVFQAVTRDELPVGATVLTSTWAMKKKANGTYRARLNARGYEQIDGEHYDENTKAAPVVNEATIRIVLILMVMAGWYCELLDVKGAFLHGEFDKGQKIYMKVPEGFEKYYAWNVVLLLLRTLYGLKQAAFAFWQQLLMAFRDMEYNRSKADPCLYFCWTAIGLILWISWVDDCLVVGKKGGVLKAKEEMMSRFDCDEVGEMKEYVGCKVERDWENGSLKLTQPVLLQSFTDEFDLPDGNCSNTPAVPGDVLRKGNPGDEVPAALQATYRSGVGKLLHMMKWTRPETLNAVRELSRFMTGATMAHLQAMYRVMKYCLCTPHRGLVLKPTSKWDGDPKFEFTVEGRSDSDYAKDPEKRRSVSGYSTFLCGAPVTMKSRMQGCVTLSVTEAELVSATHCAQDMLFIMRVLESIGLCVKKPMILKVDNKGAMDLANNWSVGGRTRHVDTRQYFLRELKEEGIINVEWIPTAENSSDLFTKNLPGPSFNKHMSVYCGVDAAIDSQGEGVTGE